MIALVHLWKECNALQTLSLEYGHDRFDHRVVLTTERLVLQYSEQSVDDHGLVIIIRTGGASIADGGCDRVGSGFQFIEGSSLEDEWCELKYTDAY